MYDLLLTAQELTIYLREEIYSLRFAVLVLTLIILLFIVVQICELLYALFRSKQKRETVGSLPTEIIVKNLDKTRQNYSEENGERERDKISQALKEGFMNPQLLTAGKGSTKTDPLKEEFDERSLKYLKTQSTSARTTASKSSNSSKNSKTEEASEEEYFGKMKESFDVNAPQLPPGTKDSLMVISGALVPLTFANNKKDESTKEKEESHKVKETDLPIKGGALE